VFTKPRLQNQNYICQTKFQGRLPEQYPVPTAAPLQDLNDDRKVYYDC